MTSRARPAGALVHFLDISWVLAASVVCSLGVVSAWRVAGAGGVLAAFMAGAALGGAFVIPWISTVSWRSTPLLIGGPGVGAVSVITLGLARLIGVDCIPVLALFVVSAPGVRAAAAPLLTKSCRRPAVGRLDPRADPANPSPLTALELDRVFVVSDVMTDEDLCQAWRSSYVALSRATTVSSLLRVVEMRALYLDEFERRAGPAALQAWFRSGARAAGDPSRSLSVRDPGSATDGGPA